MDIKLGNFVHLWSWPWVWARAFHKTGKYYDLDDEEIGLHEEHEHDHKNTNVNLIASFIHVLGDALQNVGVLIEGIIVFYIKKLSIADPISTYIFSIIFGLTTIHILKDCIFVLMEGSPFCSWYWEIKKGFNSIEGVNEIQFTFVEFKYLKNVFGLPYLLW